MEADVVVIGAGAAGLMCACAAAQDGGSVVVLERAPQLGGTAAVSGGMLWIPNNPHMSEVGASDTRKDALDYLAALSLGTVDRSLLEAFVDGSLDMLSYLEHETPARFRAVDRPDYRPELPGAKPAGRSLDNLPYACGHLADIPVRQRFALPVVHEERRLMRRAEGGERVDRALLEQRAKDGIRTLGGALAGALLTACIDRSVTFIPDSRVSELIDRDGRIEGIKVARGAERQLIGARRGVVVASGGFEWNAAMKAAFLGSPECIPVSPPYNDGDGILLGLRAGAAVANMTQAWWVPTYRIPGELDDGCPKARHIADELALPGSIVVNSSGQRFVNEATNYNDLGRAFAQFDIGSYRYENALAWLVFDNAFRSRYIVATLAPDAPAPDWWSRGDSPRQLAEAIGVDADALTATIAGFNDSALRGVDEAFRRGESVHDRYYGDDNVAPNPCLAPLTEPPYFAIEVHSGAFGTKGGLAIDSTGRVLTTDGRVIDGLYAAGNASAAITGPGYPGAGATLASALTFGFLVGRALR